jgi:hypothetical protein
MWTVSAIQNHPRAMIVCDDGSPRCLRLRPRPCPRRAGCMGILLLGRNRVGVASVPGAALTHSVGRRDDGAQGQDSALLQVTRLAA